MFLQDSVMRATRSKFLVTFKPILESSSTEKYLVLNSLNTIELVLNYQENVFLEFRF